MDKIDQKILQILLDDAKITNAQLSKEIGLSPSSTLERVRKLESEIIEKYTIVLNHKRLKLGYLFFLYIKLNPLIKESIENFINIINQIPEVIEINKISGIYNFVLKISCTSLKSYDYLVSEVISDIEEVRDIKSEIIFENLEKRQILPTILEDEVEEVYESKF